MPSPEKSAVTGRKSFGGSTSVGGVSSGAASRRRTPQPNPAAAVRMTSVFGAGTHPEMYAIYPALAIASHEDSKATLSDSAGNSASSAASSVIASFASTMRILFSTRESFSCIFERRISGRTCGSGTWSRRPSTESRSFFASEGSKSPYSD